jgi:hypothetical protein
MNLTNKSHYSSIEICIEENYSLIYSNFLSSGIDFDTFHVQHGIRMPGFGNH